MSFSCQYRLLHLHEVIKEEDSRGILEFWNLSSGLDRKHIWLKQICFKKIQTFSRKAPTLCKMFFLYSFFCGCILSRWLDCSFFIIFLHHLKKIICLCSLEQLTVKQWSHNKVPLVKVAVRSQCSFSKSLFNSLLPSSVSLSPSVAQSDSTVSPLRQLECRRSGWSSMSCAPCGKTRDTARPSRSATSSTWTREAASSLSTEAAAATTTTLRPWRPAWRRACSQVGSPRPEPRDAQSLSSWG